MVEPKKEDNDLAKRGTAEDRKDHWEAAFNRLAKDRDWDKRNRKRSFDRLAKDPDRGERYRKRRSRGSIHSRTMDYIRVSVHECVLIPYRKSTSPLPRWL